MESAAPPNVTPVSSFPPDQNMPPTQPVYQAQPSTPIPSQNESDRTILVIVLLVLVPIVGVILMWMWTSWPKWAKILISIFLLIIPFLIFLAIFSIFILSAINPAAQMQRAECMNLCQERYADTSDLQTEMDLQRKELEYDQCTARCAPSSSNQY